MYYNSHETVIAEVHRNVSENNLSLLEKHKWAMTTVKNVLGVFYVQSSLKKLEQYITLNAVHGYFISLYLTIKILQFFVLNIFSELLFKW